MDRAIKYKVIDSSISQNIFSNLKCLACNAEKSITVEDNKQRMNIANICIYIYIYTQIYIHILYVTRMTQNGR